ncbi:hypothetical protein ACFQE1_09520 [Halobium palmae]|uniref:MarR family transcriptional regulator n=1 Tax=Halobium palmae TaxID=1776492 RepID=A0ABD5RZF2_9EURY
MISDGYGYRRSCKHCGVKPFSEGPHHGSGCVRHQSTTATESELALSKECRHCGVRPFVAGPHHADDCLRYFDVESTGALADADADEGVRVVDPSERATLDGVLAAFESAEVPLLTAEEVAERLDRSPEAASSALNRLADRGDLYRKRLGSGATVFLLLDEGGST